MDTGLISSGVHSVTWTLMGGAIVSIHWSTNFLGYAPRLIYSLSIDYPDAWVHQSENRTC
jgi:hypothetical protein